MSQLRIGQGTDPSVAVQLEGVDIGPILDQAREADSRGARQRVVRDHLFRGFSAERTLGLWERVRRGEAKWIFPFQEQADVMFNSSLIYELCALKGRAEPLLKQITSDVDEYAEARRLLRFLSYFLAIKVQEVPPNSILREFIGGSVFKY